MFFSLVPSIPSLYCFQITNMQLQVILNYVILLALSLPKSIKYATENEAGHSLEAALERRHYQRL